PRWRRRACTAFVSGGPVRWRSHAFEVDADVGFDGFAEGGDVHVLLRLAVGILDDHPHSEAAILAFGLEHCFNHLPTIAMLQDVLTPLAEIAGDSWATGRFWSTARFESSIVIALFIAFYGGHQKNQPTT